MSQNVKTIEIQVNRLINASPVEVYEAWLDFSGPVSPWSGVVKAVVNAPKIDGLFYSMYQLEEREISHYGRFLHLEKPRKIQYTWVSEATHGMESIVTVSFEPSDHKTRVSIHHTNLPDDEGGRNHKNAWGYLLGRLSSHFNK